MRNFSARETEWLQELDGIELAGFWRRAIAFMVDWTIVGFVFSLLAALFFGAALGVMHLAGKPLPDLRHYQWNLPDDNHREIAERNVGNVHVKVERLENSETEHIVSGIILPILYFGTLLWKGKGQTPGKRLMRIRVVSLMHRHITFWHAVERALGYGAAALEGGFGFVQFFIHPYRRCAQDRLAETIVVTERGYVAMQHKLSHALVPDDGLHAYAPEA